MKKIYKILKEDLLTCSKNGIIDVELVADRFKAPVATVKRICRENYLKFQKTTISKEKKNKTIQCPICYWSGAFKFSRHLLDTNDNKHQLWIKELIEKYKCLRSCNRLADLEEIKQFNISSSVLKNVLKEKGVLKEFHTSELRRRCPVCEWVSFGVSKHIIDSDDDTHKKLRKEVIEKYLIDKMSCTMLTSFFKISASSVWTILKDENVKIRTHQEAVVNAIQKNRHNINAYGISGYRKDLDGSYRSIPEANFARILQHRKIKFEHEIPFNLYDENGILLTTYFLDFLIDKKQGFEIKGFGNDYHFKNKEKVVLFIKQYPEIKLKVIYCSSKEWKKIESKYRPLIPLWETQKRNLRTNQEIYAKQNNS